MSEPGIRTILAVDDEPANLALLVRILADHAPMQVHTLDDPREALHAFEQVQPDMVLLDINMPHLTGFDVMGQLKATMSPDDFVPILIMTANVDPEIRREALAMGAHDFITKPFDPTEVRLRVRNFLRTRQLYVQLEQQNALLEERVSERTRDLTRANEQLVAADRMKSDFLAMVSHEMRTPLTLIKGFMELIVRRWDQLPEDQRAVHAEAIERNLSRLETMIVNLLQAAELESFDGTGASSGAATASDEITVESLIQRAVDSSMLAPDAVEVDCAAGGTVRADVEVLEPVLTNLLDNAHKYGRPPVEVRCAIDQRHVEVSVRDHGEGVPEEFTEKLFERFTQASVGDQRTATGSGLGLWIARRLAEAHGAELTYEPTTTGALFRVRLPRASASG